MEIRPLELIQVPCPRCLTMPGCDPEGKGRMLHGWCICVLCDGRGWINRPAPTDPDELNRILPDE